MRLRKLLVILNQTALSRGRAFEQEPFGVFCGAVYKTLEDEGDRQIWRERLFDWATAARAKYSTSPPGAARLLAILGTGKG